MSDTRWLDDEAGRRLDETLDVTIAHHFFPLGLNSSIQLRNKIIGFTEGLKYS